MPTSTERKLAAIMFTDIAGYTAQMSKDESRAMELLKEKEAILKPLLEDHKGTFVKSIGDGTLTYFESAINAATCAVQLQELTYESDDLNIRAGIHIGDIVFKDNDVFGDGVNVSARLESMAPIGGVCVSKNVFDELINQDGFEGVELGLQSLKGVGRLVEVYGLKGAKLNEPNPNDYKDTKVSIHEDDEVPSITIIPFDNKGADEDAFYAYGISSDLISDVASAGVIRVSGIKDVEELGDMPFKDKANELNTRYVSTGTLWKMGDMFQLSIELHDTKESSVIWSDRWQEKWENLTIIKEKLSSSLLEALNTKPKVESVMTNNNSEAYEYYLKAKYKLEFEGLTQENLSLSRSLAEKAIELDPTFLKARMVLMSTYIQVGEFKKGLEICDIIIEIAQEVNTPKYIAIGYFNKALQSFIKMQSLSLTKDKDENDSLLNELILNANKSIAIAKDQNDLQGQLVPRNIMALALQSSDQFQEALLILKEMNDISGKIDDENQIGKNNSIAAFIYGRMGDYSSAIKFLNKELENYKSSNKPFLGVMALFQKIDAIIKQGTNLESDYLDSLYENGENVSKGSDGDSVALGGLYTSMGLIKIIQEDYNSALEILSKSQQIYDNLSDNSLLILITYCKKMLGEDILSSLDDLEERVEKYSIDEIDAYYLYQVFGMEKGKKYLEEGFNYINRKKIHLEDKILEEFCNARYVKLISDEWEKINN